MSNTPEKITAEGRSVADAVNAAAEQLSVAKSQIRYELDLSHFRTPEGRSRPMDSVKIIAWALDADLVAAAPPWAGAADPAVVRKAELPGDLVRPMGPDTWVVSAQYSESFLPRIFRILRDFLLTPSG